jgi:branched-chain amino acid aminotransferase
MEPIKITLSENLKKKPIDSELVFGKQFTDHMFVMDYSVEKGWHNAEIKPYSTIEMDPAMMVFHYGQAIFEGMKAYRNADSEIVSFRPKNNFKRLNDSAERLCIAQIDEVFALKALKKLIEIDKEWVPSSEGTSLYIRPFIIATDPFLGVRPSNTYKFMIILSPVGPYYAAGFNPVKIYVEDEYVRSAKGSVGDRKAAGNYAASLYAAKKAKEKGYAQVLWLDANEHKYVEEVGAMNIFFKIDGKLITSPLSGSILPGITRASIIELARHMGYDVEERRITIHEVFEAANKNKLEECFGTGTAAVISPVGELKWLDRVTIINENKTGKTTQALYDKLTGIQLGKVHDEFNWVEVICQA